MRDSSITIQGIICSTSHWVNFQKRVDFCRSPEAIAAAAKVKNHTHKNIVSVPMLFSFHYQLHLIPAAKANHGLVNIQMRRDATAYAIVKVLKILDSFKLPLPKEENKE